MAAPKQVGSTTAQQWGLREPLRSKRSVDVTGDASRDMFFVRSPVTGDVRGVPLSEARKLILDSNWEPVVEPSAVRLLERQVLKERASQMASAATGVYRGLSGGLSEFLMPQGDELGGEARRVQREEAGGGEIAGEILGSIAPFAGPLKGARLGTVPGLAEAAGAGVTKAIPGKIAARAAGVGLEGGVIGTTYAAGESAIEDSPLTAQKLMGGFLAGAAPGLVIGTGIGAGESLFSRLAARGGIAREDVLRPGLTDADILRIGQREHGVGTPGMIEDLQAAVIADPNVSPDFALIAKDRGPVGQQVRRELLNADELRAAAERRAAAGLDAIQEVDELALDGWTAGERKRAIIERAMDGLVDQPDVQGALMEAITPHADLDRLRLGITHAPQHDEAARFSQALAQAEDELAVLRERGAPPGTLAHKEGQIQSLAAELEGAEIRKQAVLERSDRPDAIERVVKMIQAAAAKDPAVANELTIRVGGRAGKGPLYGWEPGVRRGLASADQNVIKNIAEVLDGASVKARRALEGADAPRAWRSQPVQLLDDLGQEADALMGQPRGVLGESRAKAAKVRDLILEARRKILAGDRVEAHIALDNMKKQLSPHAMPDQWLGANDNVARFVRDAYEDARKMLENPALWGQKAAAAQRDMNALFHKRLARKGEYFDNFFEDAGVPHPRNPWINARRASAEKVHGALRGVIKPDDSPAFGSYKGHVAETRDLIAKMKEHYDLSPAQAAQLDAALGKVDEAEKAFTDAVHYNQRSAQRDVLFNSRGNVVPGYLKWVGMGFLGPAGFAAGALAERLANPGRAIFQRAVLERALRGSESRIAKVITKLVTGKDVRFMGLGVTQLAARASVSSTRERDPEKRATTYANTLKEIAKLSTPEAATAQAQEAMPFAVGTLPQAPAFMGMTMSKAAQYVASKAPVRPKMTPLGVVVDPPSDAEMDRFERVLMGAFDPLSAVEDAANGDGSKDAMDAAEFVAPELVQEVRMLLLEELGNGGFRRSYDARVDVSIVLGVPLDATMLPEHINTQQMVHASRFQAQEDNRRTYQETGVNEGYRDESASKADRIEKDEPPK